MLRAGPLLVSNRGDKQSRFLTLYFKARTTRFLITHPLSITKPVSGFSKSVHALGSGHLFLLRRDNTIWNRVLFGIGRAFLEKAALVDLRGYGAPHPPLFVVARDDVDLLAGLLQVVCRHIFQLMEELWRKISEKFLGHLL